MLCIIRHYRPRGSAGRKQHGRIRKEKSEIHPASSGLFASMSQQLKTVYPMTAVFNISGYYNANMFQVLIGVVILMVCVILSLLILKGLNRKTK